MSSQNDRFILYMEDGLLGLADKTVQISMEEQFESISYEIMLRPHEDF